MPLINGQKMACEPCIRGHRSTKCTHANERLMVPVRKPGRPLSACPHSKNQTCGCGNVTAAIPRKQKCHCGTSSNPQQAASPIIKAETDESDAAARSPTRASSNSISNGSTHRVQKSTSKTNGAKNPTIDTSKLERMDPSQFNIITSPGGTQQQPNVTMSPSTQNMFAYGSMGTNGIPAMPGQPMMYPMFPQPIASPITNGASVSGTNTGSCCGGGSKEATNSQPSTTHTSPAPDTSGPPNKGGSCCSSKAPAVPVTQNGASGVMPSPVATNGMMMPGFPGPMAMAPNGMYSFYPQPTVFTYPPQYGSFMQPLQPDQWRHFIANMNFAQPVQQNGPNGHFEVAATMGFPAPGTTTMGGGTSHQCGCGEGCQCVGCAAHPYNEATQNYVRSAWNSMMEEPQTPVAASHSRHHRSQSNHNGYSHTGTGDKSEVALLRDAINGIPPTNAAGGEGNESALMKDAINGIPPTASAANGVHGEGNVSPPAPQTPSDAASSLQEEQTLSANDFFFVSYPFGDACAGDTASCPCGDDCQCIGCAIHGNPVELGQPA
ncbi:copper fist DNA binding domain-containing protein [Sarocladium implicatum]|nr:copper fist DNA binding domain-containing protein [Sarocladium implicatum]